MTQYLMNIRLYLRLYRIYIYLYIYIYHNILGVPQGRSNKESWETDGRTDVFFTGPKLDLNPAAPQRLL